MNAHNDCELPNAEEMIQMYVRMNAATLPLNLNKVYPEKVGLCGLSAGTGEIGRTYTDACWLLSRDLSVG